MARPQCETHTQHSPCFVCGKPAPLYRKTRTHLRSACDLCHPPTDALAHSLTHQICHQAPHQFASPFVRCSSSIAGCTHLLLLFSLPGHDLLLLLLLLLYSLDLSCCCCPQLNFLAPQCSRWTSSPFMIFLFLFFSSMTFHSFFPGSRLGVVAVE